MTNGAVHHGGGAQTPKQSAQGNQLRQGGLVGLIIPLTTGAATLLPDLQMGRFPSAPPPSHTDNQPKTHIL